MYVDHSASGRTAVVSVPSFRSSLLTFAKQTPYSETISFCCCDMANLVDLLIHESDKAMKERRTTSAGSQQPPPSTTTGSPPLYDEHVHCFRFVKSKQGEATTTTTAKSMAKKVSAGKILLFSQSHQAILLHTMYVCTYNDHVEDTVS